MELELHDSAERPDLGILTMADESGQSFRGNRENFLDLVRTGRQLGASVCVISHRDLRPSFRRILCHTYDEEKQAWVSRMLPLPRVIYNRIPFRKDEMRPDVQATLSSCLRHSQLQLFNPTFFNKWTLYEWLGKAHSTRKFIPVTKRLASQHELETLLRQYPILYLKPVRGKAGKGIMKIERVRSKDQPKFEYWLSIQEQKGSLTSKYANLTPVWRKILEIVGQEEYIAQQGILLSSHRKRPFDLRVLVQKNGKGIWSVTGIGARIAGKQSITTHVPRGGSIDDPEKLLSHSFGPDKAKKLMAQVKKAALLIASQIEKKSGNSLGEMSMDLGIDMSGGIWFFEANSKPMKFDEPHIRQRSLRRIVQYAQYLIAKKKREHKESNGKAFATGHGSPAESRRTGQSNGGLEERATRWPDLVDLNPQPGGVASGAAAEKAVPAAAAPAARKKLRKRTAQTGRRTVRRSKPTIHVRLGGISHVRTLY
ncbi:YheC/YheD family protein [Paenibacillus thermoaerophilus]|uniref:YheC/YheD family protein n=1 Tax=Paenibacillus thermoaerophilus TaxID=1215385 RepID=A0ABW2V241_9BACL|nr:YheC/YheD family protein [Paenibacillus thermoaerophilus]